MTRRIPCSARRFVVMAGLLAAAAAPAETIVVSPDLDGGLERIEAAGAGDEVVLSPGVYRYRLAISNSGTPSSPLVIRAQDPANPPVFDYSGAELTSWPGGISGVYWRAGWVVTGSDIEVRSVAFRGAAQDGGSPAGIRVDGARVTLSGLDVRGCGGGVEVVFGRLVTVENSRLHANRTHLNFYGGGPIVVRGNVFTDAEGTNIYAAGGDLLLEANWFTRAGSFGALIDACAFACGGTGTQPIARHTVIRGNVFVQNPVVANPSFFIGFVGSGGPSADGTGLTQPNRIDFAFNSVVGKVAPPTVALLANADATHQTALSVVNNAFENFGQLFEDLSTDRSTLVDGGGSWVTGTPTFAPLPPPIIGESSEWDSRYRPLPDSGLIDNAVVAPPGLVPQFELQGDELTPPGTRPRMAARTIGAFEYGLAGDAGPSADAGDDPSPDGGPVVAPMPDAGRSPTEPLDARRYTVGCSTTAGPVLLPLVLMALRRRARARRTS